MSQTLQIINIIVLIITIVFALYSLYQRNKVCKKKQRQDEETIKIGAMGAEIATHDKNYRAFVNDITDLANMNDPHAWYFKMPDSALKHLEECFEGDKRKVYLHKRAIELSIEHFAIEMADDAECARIIEERVFKSPNGSETVDSKEYRQEREESMSKK